ncbi:MAG: LytTR family DNA-binding domain-containing protein [Burkholderiaceae bacterium]
MTTTALIAEDEPLLATTLQSELASLWPELEVVAVAPNGAVALRELLAHEPDVAFLDIRMPALSGIEVAEALVEDWTGAGPPPLLVFVTAFDQFAVDAFAHAAVDYVLKPVQTERLAVTVDRLRRRLAERTPPAATSASAPAETTAAVAPAAAAPGTIDALAEQMRRLLAMPGPMAARAAGDEPLRLIRAGVGDTVRMIRIDEVIYLQAADKYVNVVTANGEALIRESLRDLLPRLDPSRFVQVHRGTVVNLDFVRAAVRDDSGKLALQLQGRDERPTVSRLYAHLFKPM